MSSQALIISAFPGTGKTWFANNTSLNIRDSDSSRFSWLEPGVRNPKFPKNYMAHIKEERTKRDIILVSSHAEVRTALINDSIPFVLMHPPREEKEIYLQRYRDRGDKAKFIIMMDDRWNDFMDTMTINCGNVIRLQEGKYLGDYVELLLEVNDNE